MLPGAGLLLAPMRVQGFVDLTRFGCLSIHQTPLGMRAACLPVGSPEVTLGQLLQAFVSVLPSLLQNALEPGHQLRLSPIVAGSGLSARGVACIRATEQCSGCSEIVGAVFRRWKRIPGRFSGTGVLVDER